MFLPEAKQLSAIKVKDVSQKPDTLVQQKQVKPTAPYEEDDLIQFSKSSQKSQSEVKSVSATVARIRSNLEVLNKACERLRKPLEKPSPNTPAKSGSSDTTSINTLYSDPEEAWEVDYYNWNEKHSVKVENGHYVTPCYPENQYFRRVKNITKPIASVPKPIVSEVSEYVHENIEDKKTITVPDFETHINTWLPAPNEQVRQLKPLPSIDVLEKPTHPASNAYLVGETLLPRAAHIAECTSLNAYSSCVIKGDFADGSCNPDAIIMPLNKRGHPQNLSVTYYAFGNGIGNTFSSKYPLQVLGVLNARYLNKVPIFEKNHTST